MLLINDPVFATLKAAVQMEDAAAKSCSTPAGTLVRVLGETTPAGQPRTGLLLVRAESGPCAGAKAVVHLDRLVMVDAPGK